MLHPRSVSARCGVRVCLLLLLLVSPCLAQHFTFANFGMDSGLSNLNVVTMLEDHTGVVWLGTEGGVFTANGGRFEKQNAFRDAGLEIIQAMQEDGAGRIWAMDSSHIVYLEGGVIHQISGLDLSIFNMPDVGLLALRKERDAVYLIRKGELLRIGTRDQGRSWQVSNALPARLLIEQPELHSLTSVTSVDGSVLWAGCGKKICRIDLPGASIRVFAKQDGVAPDNWKRLLLSRSGTLWARGEHSVVRMPQGSTRFAKMQDFPARSYLNVQWTAIVEDEDGRILLNLDKGIARSEGNGWRIFNQKNGMAVDEIQALMVDHSGNLWLAAIGHGITRWLGYGNWENWTKADGLSSNLIWSSPRDEKGRSWVASETNLDLLDPTTSRIVPQSGHYPFHRLRAAVVDTRQHVWTGDGMGHVVDFDPLTGRARVAAAGLGDIYQLLIDREERIWVCSRKGLLFFSPADRWSSPQKVQGSNVSESHPWSMSESNTGVLWVTTGAGLSRLEGGRWATITLPFPGGRAFNFLAAPAADGTLWAQSKMPFPLLHLKVTGDTAALIDRVDGATLVSDNITFMGTDRRGWLWVGSDYGVQIFDGSRWVHCASEDGLVWDDTDFQAFFPDPDGSVWIGTSAGLSHLLHPEKLFTVPPPEVRIVDARIGDKALDSKSNSKIDVRKPSLNVRLLSTSYNRSSALSYLYRLEGQENAWQETDQPNLRFPALAAGKYRLTVLAYDRRLHERSLPQTISFTVLEPWWKRPWADVLEAILLQVLVYAVWRFSVRIFVARQEELESLVALRTRQLEEEKTELLNARSALIEMTRRDTLTGVFNRAAIFERMSALCEVALTTRAPLAVVMADLDWFKLINDEYGHVVGDTVIRECAARINRTIRPLDAVGRYGGEELLILMPGLSPESAMDRMEQLRLAISGKPVIHEDVVLDVTCSFGVAWFGGKRCPIESLISMADSALYIAKRNGRNRVEYAYQGGDKAVLTEA